MDELHGDGRHSTSNSIIEASLVTLQDNEALQAKVGLYTKRHVRRILILQFLNLFFFSATIAADVLLVIRAQQREWLQLVLMGTRDVRFTQEHRISFARVYALTGKLEFRDEYFQQQETQEDALREVEAELPEIWDVVGNFMNGANSELLNMERRAFEHTIAGNVTAAKSILFGPKYIQGIVSFDAGLATLVRHIEDNDIRRSDAIMDRIVRFSVWCCVAGQLAIMILAAFLDHRSNRLSELADHSQLVCESASLEADLVKAFRPLLVKLGYPTSAAQECYQGCAGRVSKIRVSGFSQLGELSHEDIASLKDRVNFRKGLWVIVLSIIVLGSSVTPAILAEKARLRQAKTRDVNALALDMLDLLFYDVVLTNSARICTLTGEAYWAERYEAYLDPIDEAIAGVTLRAPEFAEAFTKSTGAANDALVAAETQALDLCVSGNASLGTSIVMDETYMTNKDSFMDGLDLLHRQILKRHRDHRVSEKNDHLLSSSILLVCSILQIGCGLILTMIERNTRNTVKSLDRAATRHATEECNVYLDSLVHVCMGDMGLLSSGMLPIQVSAPPVLSI